MKSVRPSGPPEELGIDPSTEEGFVLARVDQKRTLREIAEISGIPEERVHHIVDGLVRRGALAPVPPDEPPSRAALPADESGAYTYQALGAPVAEDEPSGDLFDANAIPEPYELGYASSFDDGNTLLQGPSRSGSTSSQSVHSADSGYSAGLELYEEEEFGAIAPPPVVPYAEAARARVGDSDAPDEDAPWGEELHQPEAEADPYNAVLGDSIAISQDEAQSYAEAFANGLQVQAPAETAPSLPELPDDEGVDSAVRSVRGEGEPSETYDEAGLLATDDATPVDEPQGGAAEGAESEADAERNYRKIYETKFHKLMPDVRAGLAPQLTGPDLAALCLDPDPKVVAALMTNASFSLTHARLVAFHHRTPTGLDLLASRVDFVRDGLVYRRLIRNTQLSAATLRRIMQPRRLLEIYKVAIDRDIPELSRTNTRGLLRTKFTSQAQPEERAELIVNTEARVLQVLSGCPIDGRTTQILCGKQVYSAMFVQNVARFGASPPSLLAYLAKLPFVRRNAGLKKALMQHPNMPGDVKRSL